ncbi:hypothetical protein [Peribacillus sp. FSL P2-0133]|uniref:hypothetical protein n=1 Tax=Peribacillus sp. FSL P2-0133 TaxID=2921573 RepID=UPI0030CE04B1
MQWLIGVVLIPLITVVLSSLVALYKERVTDITKAKQILKERQLLELYNGIFIAFLKYNHALKIDWETVNIEVEEETHFQQFLEIENAEIWDSAMEEVSKLVHKNVHLLVYQDLGKWYEMEQKFNNVSSEDDLYDAYNAFLNFIRSSVSTYGSLYHDFHLSSKEKIKSNINKLKYEIKEIKNNSFYSEEKRMKLILQKESEIKDYKKFGFRKHLK